MRKKSTTTRRARTAAKRSGRVRVTRTGGIPLSTGTETGRCSGPRLGKPIIGAFDGVPTFATLAEAMGEAPALPVMLPTDSKERKDAPIVSGVIDYWPLALAALARLSRKGNDKHNPGEPMHHARSKGGSDVDCIANHLIDRGTVDEENGELHDVALAWRAMSNLEKAEEKRLGKGLPRGAKA